MLSHDCEVQVEKLIATPAYKEAKSVCLYLSLPSEVFKSGLDCFLFESFSSKLYVGGHRGASAGHSAEE